MSGLVVKNNSELWFNNNKISNSIGTNGLYIDSNRNLFFNNTKIASGNLNNPLGLHLINNELAYDGVKFETIQSLISSLFINREQGFAFDFNDLSTMYQDSAGTIPVTGVGQPVGKVLDKSGNANHATQSTSAKRPILQQNATTGAYYLAFDGVDDCLATGNVDFSGSSKLSLFTGLRRNNDNTAIVVELSQTSGYSTPGAFYLVSGYDVGTNGYTVAANNPSVAQTTNVPALDIAVISLAFDKSTTTLKIRRNAVAGTNGNTDTGNFANFPVFIGARNQSSLRFNGHLYSLIGISRLATPTEITNAENVIAKNVGVTL